MSILDLLIARIVPHVCIHCGAEGKLLCATCSQKLPAPIERCYRCQEASTDYITCSGCLEVTPLLSLKSAVAYEAAAKDLIWKLKSSGAQAAAEIMAGRMQGLVPTKKDQKAKMLIIPVPTATSRVRQRGFDQTTLMARQLAKQTRLPWSDCLARLGQAHQVGASRNQRLAQLKIAFRVSQRRFMHGAHIILVDDVATTGSTLEAAANTLQTAGAARIEAVTFAQTG